MISKHQLLTENAKIIMNENVFKGISPEELADRLDIKYVKFRRLFKEIVGCAPAQYFQGLKIKSAKQLLLETSCSVREISQTLNYNSLEHFVKLFKKRTGYTPSEYRHFSRR